MLPDTINIVFDRQPPSARRLNISVTTGRPYVAIAKGELGLYTTVDDNGRPFNITTWGRTYTNNGYWHIDDEEYRNLMQDDDD